MKSILISCISIFAEKDEASRKLTEYSSEGIKVSEKQTNAACVKFLLKKLERDGKKLDTYIRVQSNDVENDSHTMKYLDESISELCSSEDIAVPENCDFFLREDEKEHRYDRVLSEISEKILSIADNDPQLSIYLDMAGGKRDNYVFIQLLTKLLSFYGFEVHTYYADIAGEIVNTDLSFGHMEILDAVNEFVRTGSVTLLRRCYNNTQNRSVEKLLKAMDEFSTSIQLCSTDIVHKYQNLEKRITEVDKKLTNNSGGLFMIRTMIPLIRKKFGFESDTSNFIKEGNNERNTLKIIKWCLEHNLIQQALTIYNEKVAQIIFDRKLVEIDDISNDPKCKHGSSELVYILDNIFDNLKATKTYSRDLEEELYKYQISQNKNKQWARTIAAFFFEENFITKRIRSNIDEQLLRKILCDILFVHFARNRVNHASDSNLGDEEMMSMFSKYTPSYLSYENKKEAFKPDNIKNDLISAVESLEEALDLVDNALLTV